MSLRDMFSSAKDKWRRRLGRSSLKASSTSPSTRSPGPTCVPISRGQVPPCGVAVSESPQLVPLAQHPAHSSITQDHLSPQATTPLKAKPNAEVTISPTLNHTPTTHEPTPSTGLSKFKALTKALDSGSNVIPPFKSIARGLNTCIEIFEGAFEVRNEYKELFGGMDSILGQLNEYVGRTTDAQMTDRTMALCKSVENELKDIQEKYGKTTTFTSEDSERIMKSYERIQRNLGCLMMNTNLSMWTTMNGLETESHLKSLSPSMAAVYNSADLEDEWRRGCAPGTREKELATLLDWTRDLASHSEKVYWINGMAGTGKTTIAYGLCEELEKSAELGASFFCSKLVPECRDIKFIFPSIAYQLARFSAPFCRALSVILQTEHDLVARKPKDQFEYLLARPLAQAKGGLLKDLIVVIDALDECNHEKSIEQFLDILISQTTELDLPIRFVVSSRPEWVISKQMMCQGHGSRLVLHESNAQVVAQVIETFLKDELAGVDLTPSQLADLVRLSGAHFFSASAAARYINAGIQYAEHGDRLKAVLGLSSEPTEKDQEIDEMYESILQRAFQNKAGGKRNQDRLKALLDTIVCAQEPMTTETLAGLLGLKDSAQVEALLRPLASVIQISHTTGLVTTLHASFCDYMLSEKRSNSFHCDPSKTHALISQKCFEVIKISEVQPDICAPEPSYAADAEMPNLVERSDKTVLPHVLYACRNLATHLTRGKVLDQTKGLLWEFLSTRLMLWIEIMGDEKCMHLSPRFMEEVERWCVDNECSEETIALAHDAWKFVTTLATDTALGSAPNTYSSVLQSWPKNAPITKYYFKGTDSEDESVRDWEMDSIEPAAEPPEEHSIQTPPTPLPPNSSQIIASQDGTVPDWELQNIGETIQRIPAHNETTLSLPTPVDSTLVASDPRGTVVQLRDAQAEVTATALLESLAGLVSLVRGLRGSTHTSLGSYGMSQHPWDNGPPKLVADFGKFRGRNDTIHCVALSRGSKFIVAGCHAMRISDARGGRDPALMFVEHRSRLYLFASYFDGARSVSWLLDLTTQPRLPTMHGPEYNAFRLDTPAQLLLCHRSSSFKQSWPRTHPQFQPSRFPCLLSEPRPPPGTAEPPLSPILLRLPVDEPLLSLVPLRIGPRQHNMVPEQAPNENNHQKRP